MEKTWKLKHPNGWVAYISEHRNPVLRFTSREERALMMTEKQAKARAAYIKVQPIGPEDDAPGV